MKKINILLNGLLLGMAAACTPKEVTEITVSPEVINADYIATVPNGTPTTKQKRGAHLSPTKTGKRYISDWTS